MIAFGIAKCAEKRKQMWKHVRASSRMGNAEEIKFAICKKLGDLCLGKIVQFSVYLLIIFSLPCVAIASFTYMKIPNSTIN
jgi:hypothetical protein